MLKFLIKKSKYNQDNAIMYARSLSENEYKAYLKALNLYRKADNALLGKDESEEE